MLVNDFCYRIYTEDNIKRDNACLCYCDNTDTIELYTGYEDSAQKRIFVGDILLISFNGKKCVFEVIYEAGGFYVKSFQVNSEQNIHHYLLRDIFAKVDIFFTPTIIGNIHEDLSHVLIRLNSELNDNLKRLYKRLLYDKNMYMDDATTSQLKALLLDSLVSITQCKEALDNKRRYNEI